MEINIGKAFAYFQAQNHDELAYMLAILLWNVWSTDFTGDLQGLFGDVYDYI